MGVVRGRWLTLALGVVALAACGSNGSSTGTTARSSGAGSTTTAPSNGAGATFHCIATPGIASCYTDTLTVSGAVSVHASVNTTKEQSCATFLSHTASQNSGEVLLLFILPSGTSFAATLQGYTGPGAYSLAAPGNAGHALSFGNQGGVIVGGRTAYTAPVAGATNVPSASATAGPNGNVTITFTNLADSADPSRTVSGQATLTCRGL